MSELRAGTIANIAGTGPVTLTGQEASKANWHYNETGVSFDSSYNIASGTDLGTGVIRYNYTNVFATGDNKIAGTSELGIIMCQDATVNLAASCTTSHRNTSNTFFTIDHQIGIVWGDLA